MKIKKITSRNRQDFTAVYKCHCGFEHEFGGYDGAYFHNSVVPAMKCPSCGEIAGDDYSPLQTKYPEGVQI